MGMDTGGVLTVAVSSYIILINIYSDELNNILRFLIVCVYDDDDVVCYC